MDTRSTPLVDAAAAMVAVPFEQQESILMTEAVPADFARRLETDRAELIEALRAFPGFLAGTQEGDAWIERRRALLSRLEDRK